MTALSGRVVGSGRGALDLFMLTFGDHFFFLVTARTGRKRERGRGEERCDAESPNLPCTVAPGAADVHLHLAVCEHPVPEAFDEKFSITWTCGGKMHFGTSKM